MKKLKRKTQSKKKKPDEKTVRRNQVIFAVCAIATVLIAFGLIYLYITKAPKWREDKALKLIQSENEQERIEGLWGLAKTGRIRHAQKLCEMFKTETSAKVRAAAPLALAELNDPRAVPTLVFALGDENDAVAGAAMTALRQMSLGKITWQSVIDWWEANKGEYEDAFDHPDGLPVVSAMARMLDDEKDYVRVAAVDRLRKLKHASARPLLERAAADPAENVSRAAKEALDEL